MDYKVAYERFDWNRFYDELFNWDWRSHFNITHAAVDRNAEDEPERTALYHVRTDWNVDAISFGRLKALTNKFANVLKGLGLKEGDRVARLMPRIPETYVGFFGICKGGMVDVPLYTAFGTDAIEYRLKDCKAKALLTDTENRKRLASISDTLKDLHVIVVDENSGQLNPGDISYRDEMDKADDVCRIADTKLNDPAIIVYTSGTTGPPKGSVIFHKGVLSVVPYARYCLDVRRNEMFWAFADPGWTYGLISTGSAVMIAEGSLVVYEPRFEPEGWYKTVTKLGVANFTSAPTAFRAIMAAGDDLARSYRPNFRHLSSAGEPLNPEVIRWFEKHFGVPVRDNYGITEVSMAICNYPGMPIKLGSCGKPMPGFEVVLLDEKGRECAVKQIGQIYVKQNGFFIAGGYFGNEEKWRNSFTGGQWFGTGDQAYRDEDGYYYYVGRSDDVISSSGYRIGPFEVESCILEHPAVAECAVIGKPDPLRGEIVKACIVLRSGFEPSEELKKEITEMTRSKLSKHNYPREIVFIEELPKTSSGKVQRRLLRLGETGRGKMA